MGDLRSKLSKNDKNDKKKVYESSTLYAWHKLIC